jgi:hypothetical protein
MIKACPIWPCKKSKHFHKKSTGQEYQGAQKRLSEKVKLAKECKRSELIACNTVDCKTEIHYHLGSASSKVDMSIGDDLVSDSSYMTPILDNKDKRGNDMIPKVTAPVIKATRAELAANDVKKKALKKEMAKDCNKGFKSIAEMEKHQLWLKNLRKRLDDEREKNRKSFTPTKVDPPIVPTVVKLPDPACDSKTQCDLANLRLQVMIDNDKNKRVADMFAKIGDANNKTFVNRRNIVPEVIPPDEESSSESNDVSSSDEGFSESSDDECDAVYNPISKDGYHNLPNEDPPDPPDKIRKKSAVSIKEEVINFNNVPEKSESDLISTFDPYDGIVDLHKVPEGYELRTMRIQLGDKSDTRKTTNDYIKRFIRSFFYSDDGTDVSHIPNENFIRDIIVTKETRTTATTLGSFCALMYAIPNFEVSRWFNEIAYTTSSYSSDHKWDLYGGAYDHSFESWADMKLYDYILIEEGDKSIASYGSSDRTFYSHAIDRIKCVIKKKDPAHFSSAVVEGTGLTRIEITCNTVILSVNTLIKAWFLTHSSTGLLSQKRGIGLNFPLRP